MNDHPPLRITYLTAGAAGMYCGSCMHDNTLARALVELGVDVQLVPMYTPIQTDEEDATIDQVFFGGVNVYLQQRIGLFRHLPKAFDRLLDSPALLRWIGSRGVETSAAQLGELTLSMLRGSAGFQRKEVQRLCQWLMRDPQPDLLVLSNALVSGCVPDIKRALRVPVAVTLQGDDMFLDELPHPYKDRALEQIRRLAEHVDAFLVHSRYYAAFMADYLADRSRQVPPRPAGDRHIRLSSAASGDDIPADPPDRLRVGYLARLAPEKGLHVLVDAFIRLKQLPGMDATELLVAGCSGQTPRALRRIAVCQTAAPPGWEMRTATSERSIGHRKSSCSHSCICCRFRQSTRNPRGFMSSNPWRLACRWSSRITAHFRNCWKPPGADDSCHPSSPRHWR